MVSPNLFYDQNCELVDYLICIFLVGMLLELVFLMVSPNSFCDQNYRLGPDQQYDFPAGRLRVLECQMVSPNLFYAQNCVLVDYLICIFLVGMLLVQDYYLAFLDLLLIQMSKKELGLLRISRYCKNQELDCCLFFQDSFSGQNCKQVCVPVYIILAYTNQELEIIFTIIFHVIYSFICKVPGV